ncbi:MAG: hypothetical protein K9J37_16935 [Saprospiraceae bacterium]|nr:hypothetical protein [Saprospiraceae bacterium]MCF8251602.1 hypothetical protein [Saprospiraceae bacterium]MCF8282064.1 hypothetical protein [Bacteroidales bacterium]MCF8313497.1 hypothetical protein [Saprospiraceae bacterium]MCF8442238.1 hypothetical protein [Saprospiraceae bacterium]
MSKPATLDNIENAIKHNVVSAQDPLHTEVFVERGDRLVVKNNLQSRKQELPSTGIGLEDIKSCNHLIAKQEVVVIVTQRQLPLAKQQHAAPLWMCEVLSLQNYELFSYTNNHRGIGVFASAK